MSDAVSKLWLTEQRPGYAVESTGSVQVGGLVLFISTLNFAVGVWPKCKVKLWCLNLRSKGRVMPLRALTPFKFGCWRTNFGRLGAPQLGTLHVFNIYIFTNHPTSVLVRFTLRRRGDELFRLCFILKLSSVSKGQLCDVHPSLRLT